ncbi:MAG: beta strand repeat-containing protein [Bdellovibrio sp.]
MGLFTSCSGTKSGIFNNKSIETLTPLKISPLTKTVSLGGTLSFSASGGTSPYQFDIYYGVGSVTASGSTGTYQAPLSQGTAVVRVQDSKGDAGYATVEITEAPAIQPATKSLAVLNSFPFGVLSGKAPYVFSIVSGQGSIAPDTGIFTAGPTPGTVVIQVTDANSKSSQATITVNPGLSFSSKNIYVEKNNTYNLAATGGVAPYTYSIASGSGSVDKTSGVFSASNNLGMTTVHVIDSLGNFDFAIINTTTALRISPSSALVTKNGSLLFSGVGGVPPYSYSVGLGSGGTVGALTGQYLSPNFSSTDTVRVTDSLGHYSDATVTVTNSLSFSVSTLILGVGNSMDVANAISGGVAPLTYTVASSQGSFSGSTYTAPNIPGVYTITVYDSQAPTPNSVTATVLVNAALSLSPATATVVSSMQKSFSASGGVPPYTYSVQSGGGSINAITGVYTAPTTGGSAVILVTDAKNNTATATVTIQQALEITPTLKTLNAGDSFTFTATGGSGPYLFSLVSGSGNINSSTGLYTAPGTSGLATVRVEDSVGNHKDALVTILNLLSISPPAFSIIKNGSVTFTASGGAAPYTFSISSGDGTVNATTGAFKAPATPGTSTVRVTDSVGNIKDATVTIYDGITISPFTKNLAVNQTFTFSATGGIKPYTFSLFSGVGTVSSSGSYSSSTSGAAIVRVTDSAGNVSDATVSVSTALTINPSSKTLGVNNTYTFSATGGIPPYAFSVLSGGGSITTAGDYKAPATSTSAVVRVTDSAGNTSDATVTVNDALTLSPAAATIPAGGTQNFITAGGVSPYTYSVISGGGSFSSSTYTAPSIASGASISVLVTDSLGNTASGTLTINSITVTISSPNSSDIITNSNKASFTVNGTCSESGRNVMVSATDGTHTPVTATATCSTGSWTTALNLSSLNDAAITITANHSNVNSVSASPATVTLTKDGTLPTITITAPTANSYVNNSVGITGACTKVGPVNFSATGGVTGVTNCNGTSYTSTLDLSSAVDGSITITANHTDSAGNSATPATVTVTKDSVAPVISAFSVTNTSPTNTTTFNLSSTVVESNSIAYSCILENSTTIANCSWQSGSLPATFIVSSTNNDKILSAWVKDIAGNISSRAASNMVHLDNAAPTVSITVPSASAYINASNVAAYTVAGACNKDGGTIVVKAGSTSVGTATCLSGAWSTSTVNFSGIAEGTVSLTAVFTDLASSTATSAAVLVTKDATPPTTPSNLVDGVYKNSTSSSPAVTFTASTDAGSGVQKYKIQVVLGSDTTVILKAWADFTSGSTVSSLALNNATLYKVQIKALDNAGNESAVATSDGWTVDTTPPTAPGTISYGAATSAVNFQSPSTSWGASTDVGSAISYYEVAVGTTAGGTNMLNWTNIGNVTSATISGIAALAANTNYYTSLRAVDLAGNTSNVTQGPAWTFVCGHGSQGFTYTGSLQTLVLDSCVSTVTIKAWGAGGASATNWATTGGGGGFAQGTVTLSSYTLKIVVGGGGPAASSSAAGTSAFGGGGPSGGSPGTGNAGGGGYSGVFVDAVSQGNALVIAGGGGGAGTSSGGAGGGSPGQDGAASSTSAQGKGATTAGAGAGGTGAHNGFDGSALAGGTGGIWAVAGYSGSGGGGGYFGGGGGAWAASQYVGGAGGGSGYVISGATSVTNTTGNRATPANTGDPNYQSGVGVGGATQSGGLSGGNGYVYISW